MDSERLQSAEEKIDAENHIPLHDGSIVIYDLKPTVRGIWDAFLGINAFLLISIIVNLVLKANYFWICAKPATFSLLDYLGPWPWYILSSEFVALLHFVMAYLPFYFISKRKK